MGDRKSKHLTAKESSYIACSAIGVIFLLIAMVALIRIVTAMTGDETEIRVEDADAVIIFGSMGSLLVLGQIFSRSKKCKKSEED